MADRVVVQECRIVQATQLKVRVLSCAGNADIRRI